MQLLYLIVAGLTIRENLANVIDLPLYLVDVDGFLPLHYQGGVDDLGGCRDIHEEGLTGLR
jgi:hypothetical protein